MKGVAGVATIVLIFIGIAVLAVRITAAASASPLPLAYGFDGSAGWQHGVIKPRDIDFGAGGGLLLRGLSWASWTQRTAVGSGVRWEDDCTPDCAAGAYVKSPARLTLSDVRVHAGLRYFARMTMSWTTAGRMHWYAFRLAFQWPPSTANDTPLFWSLLAGRNAPLPGRRRYLESAS
jgi:hypothetical protein